MKKLQAYLNGLPTPEQVLYAKRCGTTIGYLRKCISTGQRIGEGICINLERESGRAVLCEDLRDDVDWAYLRNSAQALVAQPRVGGFVDHRDLARPNPYTDIDRRDPTRPNPYAGTDIDRRAAAGEGAP
jgi:DNA-binding transcriptional regulator YdaS (Cro superfamily)